MIVNMSFRLPYLIFDRLLGWLLLGPHTGFRRARAARPAPRGRLRVPKTLSSGFMRPVVERDNTTSSTPDSHRCRFLTICGVNVPARSRGTSIST
jgi:hypothetical protein